MVLLRPLHAVALACLVLLLAGPPSHAAEEHLEKSTTFIRDLADRAIETLTRPELSTQERREKFRTLFEEGFAIGGIARFVLGRYWRNADDEQKQEYLALFKQEIVTTWADRFSDYSGQRFEVENAIPAPSSGSEQVAIVASTFYTAPSNPVKVEWRVASRGDLFKITDVLVEGLSMARTQRDEYAAVISKNGGDIEALLEELRRRARE